VSTLLLKQRPKGKSLWLRCLTCGRSFRQQAPLLIFDLGTFDRKRRGEKLPFEDFFIPARVVCPYCQAEDHYNVRWFHLPGLVLGHILNKILRRGPNSWFQVLYLGTLVGRILHPFELRAQYEQQLAHNPNNPELRLRYANTLLSQGRVDEAEAQYRATLKLDPRQGEALIHLAALLGQRGETEEARVFLLRLVRIKPYNMAQRQQILIAQELLDGKIVWDELEFSNPILSVTRE
jgi:tetratricopeptide (TPR) repeat protein